MDPCHIIAFDPGGKTGVAVWDSVAGLENVALHELGPLESVDFLWDRAVELKELGLLHCLRVYSESFTITAQTGKLSQAPWSLECIGAYRWICKRSGIPFELQKPGDAKRFCDNDKLKALGLRLRGSEGHAEDAARHLVLALGRLREPSLLARLQELAS